MTQIEQAISNLNISSGILEKAAVNYFNIDDEFGYYLDQLSASMRSHARDLEDLLGVLNYV